MMKRISTLGVLLFLLTPLDASAALVWSHTARGGLAAVAKFGEGVGFQGLDFNIDVSRSTGPPLNRVVAMAEASGELLAPNRLKLTFTYDIEGNARLDQFDIVRAGTSAGTVFHFGNDDETRPFDALVSFEDFQHSIDLMGTNLAGEPMEVTTSIEVFGAVGQIVEVADASGLITPSGANPRLVSPGVARVDGRESMGVNPPTYSAAFTIEQEIRLPFGEPTFGLRGQFNGRMRTSFIATVTSVTSIPEPSAATFLVLGVCAACCRRRKRVA